MSRAEVRTDRHPEGGDHSYMTYTRDCLWQSILLQAQMTLQGKLRLALWFGHETNRSTPSLETSGDINDKAKRNVIVRAWTLLWGCGGVGGEREWDVGIWGSDVGCGGGGLGGWGCRGWGCEDVGCGGRALQVWGCGVGYICYMHGSGCVLR